MQKMATILKDTQAYLRELTDFLTGLANEGQRALVIGGAARIDVAVERLLKAVTLPCPGGNDNLFDPDRPLGTFSAKIALAHRLGLLDDPVEQCLHFFRKIRNDFAHATSPVKLSESAHRNRVQEIKKRAECCSLYPIVSDINNRLSRKSGDQEFDLTLCLLSSLIVIAVCIEMTVEKNSPNTNLFKAKFLA